MPELPEVETIVRGLDSRLRGETIDSVWIGSRRQPLKSPAARIVSTLEGSRISRVHRAGKHIVIDLEQAAPAQTHAKAKPRVNHHASPFSANNHRTAQWVVHLGMTGRTLICNPSDPVLKHTHLIAKLGSGKELRFVDPRMFGKISVHSSCFDPGGIEPLEISAEQFRELFRGRKTPIKSALLNQKLLRGVGNIYADESLFRTGIRPRHRAASLSRDQLIRLHRAVQKVLREAIKLGGSSIADYVDSDGEEGFFQLRHRVYGREGQPCLVCRSPIKRVVVAGRSSHYCAKCQK